MEKNCNFNFWSYAANGGGDELGNLYAILYRIL